MCVSSICSPETVDTAIGTSWSDSSRLRAVTTTTSISLEAASTLVCACAEAGAAANPRIIPTKVGIHDHQRLAFNPQARMFMDPESSPG